MPIEFRKDRIVFEGVAGVEEAEPLLEALQNKPSCRVDLFACAHLHTASLQVLMAARPVISRWPQDEALRAWLQTALKSA